MKKLFYALLVLLPCAGIAAERSPFWGSVGGVYRGGMKVKVSGPSAGGWGYADRLYEDGYVKRDPGTGNVNAFAPEGTWNWGYQSAEQYDGQMLRFRGAVYDAGEKHVEGGGVEFAGGVELLTFGQEENLWGSLGIAAGFQWLGMSRQRVGMRVTDGYDVSGIVMPGPGHAGSYEGPFGTPPVVPSPIIPNCSTERVGSAMDLSSALAEVWIGPRLEFYPMKDLSIFVLPRLSMNYAHLSLSGASSEDETRLGCGLIGGVTWQHNWLTLSLFGGYEWQHNSFDITSESTRVELDPSGYVLGLSIGARF